MLGLAANLQCLLQESGVSWRHGVNDLLVEGPDDGPVEVDDVLGRTLRDDELLQRLDSHTSTTDTTDGRESRIIPSSHKTLSNKPSQLALAQKRLDEVEAGKVPDVDLSQVKRIQHPLVLRVAVPVLDCSESVCDTLEAVDKRASKIVGGVHLVFCACAVMGRGVASVDDRISHGLVGVVDRHLCTEAVLDALLRSFGHFPKDPEVLLNGSLTACASDSVHSLLTHL